MSGGPASFVMPKVDKKRADVLLVERGLAESREKAQALIMEGVVYSPTGRILKSGTPLENNIELEVRGKLPFVSRGGVKLAHALDAFDESVTGYTVLDVGASTGGFTDCLLQRGADRIYAVDVGHGQLHYRLRQDERVLNIEKCNARYVFEIPTMVDLVTIDVAFISLTLILPAVLLHLKAGNDAIVLVKPQFEASREDVGRGGVIKSPEVHSRVLRKIIDWAERNGIDVVDQCDSPILGDAGNKEFFLLLRKPTEV